MTRESVGLSLPQIGEPVGRVVGDKVLLDEPFDVFFRQVFRRLGGSLDDVQSLLVRGDDAESDRGQVAERLEALEASAASESQDTDEQLADVLERQAALEQVVAGLVVENEGLRDQLARAQQAAQEAMDAASNIEATLQPDQVSADLSLGTMAEQDAGGVNITGGSIDGVTLDALRVDTQAVAASLPASVSATRYIAITENGNTLYLAASTGTW